MASAAASAPGVVVMQGTRFVIAARRICSRRCGHRSGGCVHHEIHSPLSIMSTTFGEPSPPSWLLLDRQPCLAQRGGGASSWPPDQIERVEAFAHRTAAGLSESVTVMNAVPVIGRAAPAPPAPWRMPSTHRVPRPSPLRWTASPGRARHRRHEAIKRQHGLLDGHIPVARRILRQAERGDPLAQHQAHGRLARGWPIALETNGTVREARGLASITYTSLP